MGDEGAGEAFVGIVAGGDKDYEGALPSDTVSLSDSDSDDFEFPNEAEVDTLSPEEPLALDDARGGSDGSGGPLLTPHRSPVQPFHLKGMSSSFSQRSQSIFDSLEGAAKRAVPSLAEDNVIDGRFKRPLPPPSLSNRMPAENTGRQSRQPPSPKSSPAVPDYVAHPERWTKYSLDDVSESSDTANRSIAMEFLEGLKKTREEKNTPESYTPSFNQDPSCSGAGRIVFTKPSKSVLDVSERKRAAVEENEEEAKPVDAKQELKGKPSKKACIQKEDEAVGLDHLDSGVKEVEDEKPLKLEALDDSPEAHEDTTVVGFHGSKKRSRKHFRTKASLEEKEEDS